VSMDGRCTGRRQASPEYKSLLQKPITREQKS
jgi:hypothetical protein